MPRPLAVAAVSLLSCAVRLHAQPVPELVLKPADAQLDAEIVNLRSLRELTEGRLLYVDRGENQVFVADLGTQLVRAIGRQGRGPGEMPYFGRLFALGGDSTLLTDDPSGRRWLILAGDSIVVTMRPDDPLITISSGAPRGVDMGGNIVQTRVSKQVRAESRAGFRLLDSALVIVARRGSPVLDTVLKVEQADWRVQVGGTKERPFYAQVPAYMSSTDAVAMAPDGWLAVVGQRPYRVTWRTPDGMVIRGPDLAWPRIPIDGAERRAFATRSRVGEGPERGYSEDGWAEVVPPLGGSFASIHLPDGRLLIRKLPWSNAEGTRYDIIDRTGRIVGRMELPASEWLVAAGAKHVYKVRRDDDGFERLTRHPWP